jgi:PelA/Pel-15E family pectate lyase
MARATLPCLHDSLINRFLSRVAFAFVFLLASLAAAMDSPISAKAASESLTPIAVSGFLSSAHHWREIRDETRFIKAEPNQPSYAPAQVREIVANILLFQRDNGGWPKDYDMTAILTGAQRAKVIATRTRTDTSFDNGNLHSQVAYLACACAQLHEPGWRDACVRGLDFIFSAQYPNGGFPQQYPQPKGFHAHITFNDYVMIGCLNLLKDAADGKPSFAWLDDDRRERARDAVQRGVECIKKCQIRVEGKLTGWCQQHDERTYEARPARTFELASICPQNTTDILRFLMRFDKPDAATMQAMDAAVAWLRQVQLSGIRVEKVSATKQEFLRHTADFDKVVVRDSRARPIWARHYEIGTNRPIFAGRDGVKKYALAEIERERRTGTAWYGNWPQKLIEQEYPEWRKKASGANQ